MYVSTSTQKKHTKRKTKKQHGHAWSPYWKFNRVFALLRWNQKTAFSNRFLEITQQEMTLSNLNLEPWTSGIKGEGIPWRFLWDEWYMYGMFVVDTWGIFTYYIKIRYPMVYLPTINFGWFLWENMINVGKYAIYIYIWILCVCMGADCELTDPSEFLLTSMDKSHKIHGTLVYVLSMKGCNCLWDFHKSKYAIVTWILQGIWRS